MNGVMIPEVSAGSNQVGASEIWAPQVSCPSGTAAEPKRGTPATKPSAASARRSRRVGLVSLTLASRFPLLSTADSIVFFPLRFRPTPMPSNVAAAAAGCLRALDRDVLEGCGVCEILDQPEPRLPDARPDAVDKGKLPDRRRDRLVVDELLDVIEDRLTLLVVEDGRLLLIERIDVGVVAVRVGTALDDKGGEPGRGIAKGAAATQDQVLEAFIGPSLDKGGAFERPELYLKPDRLKVVEHRLGDIRVRRIAVEFAGVEAAGKAGLSQQLFGLGRVIYRRRRLPEEVETKRNEAVGDLRVAECDRVVDRLAVESEVRGMPHPLVVPRRFRIPLVGEIEPERRRRDDRL